MTKSEAQKVTKVLFYLNRRIRFGIMSKMNKKAPQQDEKAVLAPGKTLKAETEEERYNNSGEKKLDKYPRGVYYINTLWGYLLIRGR